MRRFELVEGKSSKFWEVALEGSDVTVRFGRIGTNGQTQTKTFVDTAAATKERDRLVKEKTAKGYGEVATAVLAATTRPISAPTPETSATDLKPALHHKTPHPPSLAAIEWPSGGFAWDDELRHELPIVRGIHAPERSVELHIVPNFDDHNGFAADMLKELAEQLGRQWLPWDRATAKAMLTSERLLEPDAEFWQELLAQVLANRSDLQWEPESGPHVWVVHRANGLHGPAFVIGLVLDFARSRYRSGRFGYGNTLPLLRALRDLIAGADDPIHDAAIAALQTLAEGTPLDRLLRAHLCPHRTDWVLQSLADKQPDDHRLLASCVMSAEEAMAYLGSAPAHPYFLIEPVLLQIHLHNEGAIDLLTHVLYKTQDKRSREQWLDLAMRMRSPRMIQMLAQGIELKEVRAALDKLGKRWPAAVLKCVVEQALPARSRLAEGWALRMAVRDSAALDAVMPSLDEGVRAQFAARLAKRTHDEAPPHELPAVLVQPPWLGKARATELPTLDLALPQTQPRIAWNEEQRARLADVKPRHRRSLSLDEAFAELQVSKTGRARVEAGDSLGVDGINITTTSSYFGVPVETLLWFPGKIAVALWNSYPAKFWLAWDDNHRVVAAILAKYGESALPGLVAYVQTHPEDGLAIALPVDSTLLAPTALHALRNLKKAKVAAMEWLRAHAVTASRVAIAMAFGKDRIARDDGAFGLRWLVSHGFEPVADEVAASYGEEVSAAFRSLLDVDPLLMLPSRMPKLPSFFVAASFHHPELRDSGKALPTWAVEHLAAMLSISTLEAPYAGLPLVREACTPASLAEFAWDVFEAWSAAGSPTKENWAFIAVGLLGNDATARRLAPLIRAWPTGGGYQRAVIGLDLLATIGSDVALMHLDSIARRVKSKPLQDRAQEKIASVAETRGLTAAELADRLVPDLGLDERGTLKLDFGPRQFFVSFDETLKPFIKDAQGSRLKDLPRPIKSDDAERAEAAAEVYKQIKKDSKAVASQQVIRLELAMVDRRRWSAEDFQLFFIEHPLMRHLAARLMWGVYGADGTLSGAFRVAEDLTLADAEDLAYALPTAATVGIAHVLEMGKSVQDAFGQVFADYEILQPFKQLGRETYTLTDAERKSSRITRYASKVVATGSVIGLQNRGWRGQTEDGGWVTSFGKAIGEGLFVEIELQPGIVVGGTSYEPKQTLPALTLRRGGTFVAFEGLHPILASEALRDVELLAPYQDQ